MKKITVYTDGASRGNPGKGGWGAVLEYRDENGKLYTKQMSQGYTNTTNNRMELLGVISALRCLNYPCMVDVYSDSKYVIDAFRMHWVDSWRKKGWKRGKNQQLKNPELWQQLYELSNIHQITWNWVKGHAGHPQNEVCDRLATCAADQGPWKEDEGYSGE